MRDKLLELREIEYTYPTSNTPVLKGINLSLFQGEKIVLWGNNGAGKSTLFLIMNGILEPSSGDIFIKGELIGHSKKDINTLRRTLGLVFQDPDRMFIAPSVEGEISFGLFNLGYDEDLVRNQVYEVSKLLGIENLLQRAPHSLSGGEKKLVSIASVFVMKPKIILFDEPTAGLDSENTKQLLRALEILHEEGICILISTHDKSFAKRFAERVVVIKKGEIQDNDASDILFIEN